MNTVNFNLSESLNFTYAGFCQQDRVNIEINFLDTWRLEFFFYKEESIFLFNHIILYYKLNGPLFPNSLHEGGQSEVYDYIFVNSSTAQSYVCDKGVTIELGEVTLYMRHLRIEPYFDNRIGTRFATEFVCAKDLDAHEHNSHESLITIIVIVIIVLIMVFCCAGFVYVKCNPEKNNRSTKKKKEKVDYVANENSKAKLMNSNEIE